jgi:hypothetical protein
VVAAAVAVAAAGVVVASAVAMAAADTWVVVEATLAEVVEVRSHARTD